MDPEQRSLMADDEEIEDEIAERGALVSPHAAQILHKVGQSKSQCQAVGPTFAIDIGLLDDLAVDAGDIIVPELPELVGGVVEPDEGDDREDRDHKHQELLVFADDGQHGKVGIRGSNGRVSGGDKR